MSGPAVKLHTGDCLAVMRRMASGSVRTCVTSPPYWGLRDYGCAGQLGLEPTPDLYVAALVGVFREVRRVLSDDGTVWLNLGDSYANNGQTGLNVNTGKSTLGPKRDGLGPTNAAWERSRPPQTVPPGLKPKDLVGIPWRVAFALQSDGWYLRSDIIWAKPNPMPESVTDRPTKSHEYVFLLSKRARYFYDAGAIREPNSATSMPWAGRKVSKVLAYRESQGDRLGDSSILRPQSLDERKRYSTDGRNRRSVWTIPTRACKEAHFAVMPEALVEPCVLAGSARGDTVLDPFAGSGTVGRVCVKHGRDFIGIDLKPAYVALARRRITAARKALAPAPRRPALSHSPGFGLVRGRKGGRAGAPL